MDQYSVMVLLDIRGAINTTGTTALEVLMSTLPIDRYIEQEATLTSLRIMTAKIVGNKLLKVILQSWKTDLDRF